MQIPKPVAEGIRDGRVTRAYRRWDAPRVKVGGRQLTPAGVVVYDRVRPVRDVNALTERDSLAAGEPNLAKLRKWLTARDAGTVYRIDLHYGGPDPRLELRVDLPDEAELQRIDAALTRLDSAKRTADPISLDGAPSRNPTGPWTWQILTWIRDNPAVVSKVLATLLNRELQPMKTDIRKLKALGLTISLEVGYRISPRGAAYLEWKQGQQQAANDSAATNSSRHVGIRIDAPPRDVAGYVRDPTRLPEWAAGLANGAVHLRDGRWSVTSPLGDIFVEFVRDNDFGVVDHIVTLPSGERVLNPMRVLPTDDGSEVVFTVRRRPGMSDDEFAVDVAAVDTDLRTLRGRLEQQR